MFMTCKTQYGENVKSFQIDLQIQRSPGKHFHVQQLVLSMDIINQGNFDEQSWISYAAQLNCKGLTMPRIGEGGGSGTPVLYPWECQSEQPLQRTVAMSAKAADAL